MSISTHIIRIRYVLLAVTVAVVAASGTEAAVSPEPMEPDLHAVHWKHEDAMYDSSGLAFVQLPAPLEAHWNHEDAQQKIRTARSDRPRPAALSDQSGIDRLAVLSAGGGTLALLTIGALVISGVRRKHRRLAAS